MNRSVRYLWILMIAQACALGLVFGWRVCRRPSPYVPVKKTFADLHGGLIVTLDMFKADCGRYPTTSEAWKVLMNPPADGSLNGWRGPYLEPSRVPEDPWGHAYVYRFPSTHDNTNGFDLFSNGPDGISKTAGSDPDDINNWDLGSPHAGMLHDFNREHRFVAVERLLLIIPFLFVVRLTVGQKSRFGRAFIVQNFAPDVLWLLMSMAAVVIAWSAFLHPVVER
jgi:type II secretion system protein G